MGIASDPGLPHVLEVTGVLVPAGILDPVRRAGDQLGVTIPNRSAVWIVSYTLA